MPERISQPEKPFFPPEAREAAVLVLTPEEKEILAKLPVELPEEQVLELKRIAQVIAGDLGMKVKLGEPGKGSFFNLERCEITLDPLHIAGNPSAAKIIAAHEGAHRRLTRGPETLGVKPELIEELFGKATGFAYVSNAIEDPTVNNWTKKEFEGLRGDFDKVYGEALAKEHIPLGLDHPEAQAVVRRTGTIPNFVWVGSELIRVWHTGKFSKNIKKIMPKAAEVLGKVFLPAKRVFQTLPEYAYDEIKVLESARERFRIVYQEIWPHIQELVEEDFKNEAERKMTEERLKEKLRQDGVEKTTEDLEQGKTGTTLDDLPEESRKELAQAMRKASQAQEETQKEQKEKLTQEEEVFEKETEAIEKERQALEKRKETAAGEEAGELKKQEERLKIREAINQEKQKKIQEQKELQEREQKEMEEEAALPLEMNDLSEKLKKELEKEFNKLPQKERERLLQRAEKTLQELEDKLNETMESRLNPDQPESHKEYGERKEKEEAGARQKKEREREFAEIKETAEKIAEESKTEYDKIRAEMDDVIEDLYNRLEDFFVLQRDPKWLKGFRAGTRLTLFKAMQFASGAKPEAYREMWERKTVPKRFEYKFSLVVDLSESMSEENKIEETRKGLIVLAEVLNRLGIDFEVLGFNGVVKTLLIKDFDKEFDEEAQEKITGLTKQPFGGTPTAGALKNAGRRMKERAGKDNFIVVLTDGEPDDTEAVKTAIRNLLLDAETPIKVVGVGLGKGTGFVRDLFPSAVGNIQATKLPEKLSALLEEMIINPGLFTTGEDAKTRFIGV